jgi:hypothetical protein
MLNNEAAMKTLINKSAQSQKVKSAGVKDKLFLSTFVFFLLSFILSGSSLLPQENITKNDDSRNRWLDILVKLESGKEIPPLPKMHPFPGPFFYQDYNGKDHVIISDTDIKEIHKKLSESMEQLRKNIESFRNSEDFIIIQNELKEWNENFRKELEKIKEELIRSDKDSRSKGTIHTLM